MTPRTFRYCSYSVLLRALALGWRYSADLGSLHGEWSCLVEHPCPMAPWVEDDTA